MMIGTIFILRSYALLPWPPPSLLPLYVRLEDTPIIHIHGKSVDMSNIFLH